MRNRSSALCDANETLGKYTPQPAIDDCHTLPQTLYTSRCANVLSFERFDEEVVGSTPFSPSDISMIGVDPCRLVYMDFR